MYTATSCSSTEDTVCEQCVQCSGTEWQQQPCTEFENRVCQECTSCLPGFFQTQECLAEQDAACSICSDGFFCPGKKLYNCILLALRTNIDKRLCIWFLFLHRGRTTVPLLFMFLWPGCFCNVSGECRHSLSVTSRGGCNMPCRTRQRARWATGHPGGRLFAYLCIVYNRGSQMLGKE